MADRLRVIPKYVVSTTPEEHSWHGTTVMRGDPVAQIAALKRQIDGEIIVPASFALVRTLLANHLVDEIRVMVYPVVLGTGARLFGQISETVRLRLIHSRTLGDHLIQSRYEIVRPDPPA